MKAAVAGAPLRDWLLKKPEWLQDEHFFVEVEKTAARQSAGRSQQSRKGQTAELWS
jgi:hypothetical protein